MRRLFSLLAAALLAPLAVGCAAPAEEDSGSSENADTVDIVALKAADLRAALAGAKLVTLEDSVFQYGFASVAVAPNAQSQAKCYYKLLDRSAGAVRGVPKGDTYSFDEKGITLTTDRERYNWTWTLALVNERTHAGTAKAVADFSLACVSSQPLTAKQIVEILKSGKTDGGQPSAARIEGAR